MFYEIMPRTLPLVRPLHEFNSLFVQLQEFHMGIRSDMRSKMEQGRVLKYSIV